jgi:uncharacterized protein YbjT (DUF2867 family)
MILLTAATGNDGTEIVKRLSARNVKVRAMVCEPDGASACAMPQVELVAGDFDRPEPLLTPSME